MASGPVLTETSAGVTIRWFCPPPPKGPVFTITRQEWNADFSQRNIYEWQLSSKHLPPHLKHLKRRVNCDGFALLIEPSVPWRH